MDSVMEEHVRMDFLHSKFLFEKNMKFNMAIHIGFIELKKKSV